jgi:glyoxylate carboligase
MASPNIFLSAPIPGQSLTVEPGSVPWEQPPQFTKLADVVGFYTEKIDNPDIILDLLDALKKDIPILTIVNTLTKAALMKGYHTVDLGFLVTPILVEMIKTIAELNDVPYVVSYEDQVKKERVDPRVIKELIDEMKTKITNNPETVVDKESPKGLMSRGEK